MTREQAINYLRSSGMSEGQIKTVVNAIEGDMLKAYREAMIYLLTAEPGGYPLHKWSSEYGYVITVSDVIDVFKRINDRKEQ